MATTNPRIAAYISPDLNKRLRSWMAAYGISSVSEAIAIILQCQLGDDEQPAQSDRLATLETTVEELTKQLEELKKAVEAIAVVPQKTVSFDDGMSVFFSTAHEKYYGGKRS